jgi:hypothetical protein
LASKVHRGVRKSCTPSACPFLSPPIGVYAWELDLERFIIGRHFQSLGDRGRHDTPGLGLVKVKRTRAHPFKTEVYLTAKGRAVAAQVLQNFRRFTQE